METNAIQTADHREAGKERDRRFDHAQAIFSVSSGMIGVCLTGIGLVKVVLASKPFGSLCDDLLAIDAILFGLTALSAFRWMQTTVRRRQPRPLSMVAVPFFIALALMVAICALFGWDII